MSAVDLRNLFDRIVVINLDRRPQRWRRFLQELPAAWPFGPPLRFPAIDGTQAQIPVWWDSGGGAWGCYCSHLQIVQDALADGVESLLILEDDCVFCPAFELEVREFVRNLPSDWKLIFLGGQHIQLQHGLPSKINHWVYRPFNVNRMHAYAIRGQEMLQTVHRHLENAQNWRTAHHHVDHRLGELQKQTGSGIYVPRRWLAAQREGVSDVSRQSVGLRTFHGAEDIVNPTIDRGLVAVLGPPGPACDAVAGMLFDLGVNMGIEFAAASSPLASGEFEGHELAVLCHQLWDLSSFREKVGRPTRQHLLKVWANRQCVRLGPSEPLIGAKHMGLNLLGPEIEQAWNSPHIVSVDDNQAAGLETTQETTRPKTGQEVRGPSGRLLATRNAFLASCRVPILRVVFDLWVNDPAESVEQLIQFLDLRPENDRVLRARSRLENFTGS